MITLELLLLQLVIGTIIGAIYSLMAIGLTTIWNISGIPEFAQAGLYVIAAYVGFFVAILLNLPFFLTLIVAMIVSAILSITIEKLVYRTIRIRRGIPWMHTALIAAIGLSFLIENVAVFLWTPKAKIYPSPYIDIILHLGPISLSAQRLLILVVAIILFAVVSLFIKRTWMGKSIRATAQDLEAAQLMGINADRVYSIIFGLGGALTAAAGVLISPLYAVYPAMGTLPLVKALIVIVLGGVGSIPGAIIGGFIVGIIETLCAVFISAEYQHGYAFFILIVALLFKPEGIFGKK